MKIARVVSNVILLGMVWRLIVLRRNTLARERRARKLAPLLITAAGAGVILAARPRILEGTRRLWGRRQSDAETSDVGREPQPAVETAPRTERKDPVRRPGKPASGGLKTVGKNRALAKTEPKPGVKH